MCLQKHALGLSLLVKVGLILSGEDVLVPEGVLGHTQGIICSPLVCQFHPEESVVLVSCEGYHSCPHNPLLVLVLVEEGM